MVKRGNGLWNIQGRKWIHKVNKSHEVAMSPLLLIVIAIRQINLKIRVNYYKNVFAIKI